VNNAGKGERKADKSKHSSIEGEQSRQKAQNYGPHSIALQSIAIADRDAAPQAKIFLTPL
jgi:hypothetical protein